MIPACPPLPITGVDLWAVRLPLIEPFVISYGTFPDVPTVIIRITTRDGLTGWGEALLDAGAGPVFAVQRFHRKVRLIRNGVAYIFCPRGLLHAAVRESAPDLAHVNGLGFPV